ncbi:hypothetical protein C8K38_111182 [Rhodococcus sp. OK611]|nr:hypothetical protein C8K38_111182 [Rhodococcus sp. OK611]SNX91540.1 hypothetical protein SAMN05447004_11075 [Rhodococcus sp. OK270]
MQRSDVALVLAALGVILQTIQVWQARRKGKHRK